MEQLIQSFKDLISQQVKLDQLLREYRHSIPIDSSKRVEFLNNFPEYKTKYYELMRRIIDSNSENYWIGLNMDFLKEFKSRPFIIDEQKNYIHYTHDYLTLYGWFLGGFE